MRKQCNRNPAAQVRCEPDPHRLCHQADGDCLFWWLGRKQRCCCHLRGKDCSYDFNSKIACVLQISVSLVKEMLGNGALLSQENFFPNEKIDQGYRILLMRQESSRLESDNPKILPENMITDFEWKSLWNQMIPEAFGRGDRIRTCGLMVPNI